MKAAILGAGFIAEFHAQAYLASPDAKLCAVCDVDVEKAKALAGRFGCAWYGDVRELLEKERPELVSVCLPTYLHRECVCMALGYGAHVLCEKPLSLTQEDALAMRTTAEQTGRVLMCAQVLRWWPEYVQIAGEMRRLGAPLFVHARRFQHASREGWHQQENLGGGALFDLFVHDLDFVLSVLGTDAQVIAVQGSRGRGGSWRRVTAQLCWPGGACAQIEASSQMPKGYPFTVAFHAQYPEAAIDYRFRTAVNLSLDTKPETELLLYDQGCVRELPIAGDSQAQAFCAEVDAFISGVKDGGAALPIEETIAVMDVLHRIKAMLEAQE